MFPIFLSTLSLRRATGFCYLDNIEISISIHALLAESDLMICVYRINTTIFLSTLSLRRATTSEVSDKAPLAISIHALLAESDPEKST